MDKKKGVVWEGLRRSDAVRDFKEDEQRKRKSAWKRICHHTSNGDWGFDDEKELRWDALARRHG